MYHPLPSTVDCKPPFGLHFNCGFPPSSIICELLCCEEAVPEKEQYFFPRHIVVPFCVKVFLIKDFSENILREANGSLLLLAIGTKLEHVITQLAHEVAEKHSAIEGDLVVKPSDDHFWFHRPRIVLYLIHFILFQNAFEIAFFFWIFTAYGFNSCIMDRVGYIVPRLIIGVIIQLLCSYSTLPLYAIVTQMGSYFKKAIFDEHVQKGLLGWAQNVKKRKGGKAGNGLAKTNKSENESLRQVEMERKDPQRAVSNLEEGRAGVN